MSWLPRFQASRLALVLAATAAACGGGSDVVEPTTGTLEITTSTAGAEPDADGYSVLIDAEPAQPIGSTGNLSITAAAGSHTVQLGGVAANCAVSGDNPRTVSLTAGATTAVSFVIGCSATTGSIQVTTATTGALLDPDGYALTLDGGQSQPIGINASLTFGGMAPGTHALSLSGIASNCRLAAGSGQAIEVSPGSTATVAFSVTCVATRIAFSSNAAGLQAVFVVNPDGTGLENLTRAGTFESSPIWSPDGRKILFSKEDGLHVMNADGGGRTRLVANPNMIFEYRWSPDGSAIAYAAGRVVGGDFFADLWVMRADGSGKKRLAPKAEQPSWSPDSRRIAYTSFSDLLDPHIRFISSDGSGDTRVTGEGVPAFEPAWSPDGAQIAFVTLGDNDILVINPDGNRLVNLTQGQAEDDSPTWSPDGSRIAFNTGLLDAPLESDVGVMNRDGSSRTNLSNLAGFNFGPSWSPDGSGIVFTSSVDGNSEIYVMRADGSDQRNLSNHPGVEDTEPDWSGRASDDLGAPGARVKRRLWQMALCGRATRC